MDPTPGDPKSPAPARSNKRGDQTRQDLIEASLALVATFADEDILAALTPARVARGAGRTTGSFFHHFPTRQHFFDAMADRVAEEFVGSFPADLRASIAEVRPDDVPGVIRAASEFAWQNALGPNGLHHSIIAAMAFSSPNTTRVDGANGVEVFRDRIWNVHRERLGALYSEMVTLWGREFVDPFDGELLADILAALEFGLVMMRSSGADAISDRVFADVVLAILVVATAPAELAMQLTDIEISMLAPDASALSESITAISDERWTLLGELFSGGRPVQFTTISLVLGLPIDQAKRMFGSVRRAAALSTRAWTAGLMGAAVQRLEAAPDRALADTVVDLARRARDLPHLAQALLAERSAAAIDDNGSSSDDVRELVAITEPLCLVLATVSPDSSEAQRRSDATNIVDIALMFGSTRRRMAPSDIAQLALAALRH